MKPSQQPTDDQISQAQEGQDPDVHCFGPLQRRSRPGFTLVEILATISLIALLIALISVGAIKAQGAASRSQAQSMMRSLLGAQEQFKSDSEFGLDINHNGKIPIDWDRGTFDRNVPGATGSAGADGLSSSERFVVACLLFEATENILRAAAQDANTLVDDDDDGFLELRDPWDNEVHYRSRNTRDGNVFDGIDNDDLPQSRSPYFLSAGKDGTINTDDDINTIELEN